MPNSLIAPYKHMGVKFMPTGGLNTGNIGNYLAVIETSCAGGTWLGKSADIEAGNWDKIEDLIKDAANSSLLYSFLIQTYISQWSCVILLLKKKLLHD